MRKLNQWLIVLTVLFLVLGTLLIWDVSAIESQIIFSSPTYFVRSQLLWVSLSFFALLLVCKIPTKFFVTLGPLLFFASLGLLVAVLVPQIGVKIAGARRWLSFGGYSLQPSELMKIGLILYLSVWLQKPRRFLSFLLLIASIFGLVLVQPDLGSGLILLSIAAGMYVCAKKPLKHFVWLAGLAVGSIALLVLISPYRASRLTAFLDPQSDPLGSSYHIRQITIALGSGGLFGRGFGQSLQKYRYIPEAATDSIFAIFAEEFGFVGSICLFSLYGVLLTLFSIKVSSLQKDREEYMIGCGIIAWVGSQVLVNLSSVVALLPMTGVPLPFLSYGGTALLSVCIGIGIMIGLGRHL